MTERLSLVGIHEMRVSTADKMFEEVVHLSDGVELVNRWPLTLLGLEAWKMRTLVLIMLFGNVLIPSATGEPMQWYLLNDDDGIYGVSNEV